MLFLGLFRGISSNIRQFMVKLIKKACREFQISCRTKPEHAGPAGTGLSDADEKHDLQVVEVLQIILLWVPLLRWVDGARSIGVDGFIFQTKQGAQEFKEDQNEQFFP